MESQNETFTCTKCNIEKPVSDFYKNKRCTRGHQSHCKTCHASLKKIPKDSNESKPKPTTKTCSKCKETKHISDFNKCQQSKDSLYSQCRICHNKYFTERVTAPHIKYIEPFNQEHKKYILSHDPKDFK